MEFELSALLAVARAAPVVGRQQVARELDALVAQAEHARERLGEHGLAEAGEVLDQEMTAGQQARERERDLAVLAEDDRAERLAGRVQGCLACFRVERQ